MGLIQLLPVSFRDRYRILWYRALDRVDGARRRVSQRPLPQNPDGRIYIHLGCGMVDHPLFINVDTMGRSHIHYVSEVQSLPMFADNYADLIYCSHCLEHISHVHSREVLAEWRRILKPGGILRIGVPDFDAILDIYEAHGRDMDSIQLYLMGAQSYAANFHYAMFNERSLRAHLEAVGFRNVSPWSQEQYPETAVEDCTSQMIPTPKGDRLISLNLEATK